MAQPGVRYCLTRLRRQQLVGFVNVLEGCRHGGVEHLVYASSSSVYGANTRLPYRVHDNVDHPISLYAATKKANELMAHVYSHLYDLPTTGLRFFTVYGPWGRPDMSPSLFTGAILRGEPIEVFNSGRMQRDFTYIDDIVEGVARVLDRAAAPDPGFDPARPDPGASHAPYRLYNIGNHTPVELLSFIETIEQALGRKPVKQLRPMQAGDVAATCADVAELEQAVGFAPHPPLVEGIARFVAWYREYLRLRLSRAASSPTAARTRYIDARIQQPALREEVSAHEKIPLPMALAIVLRLWRPGKDVLVASKPEGAAIYRAALLGRTPIRSRPRSDGAFAATENYETATLVIDKNSDAVQTATSRPRAARPERPCPLPNIRVLRPPQRRQNHRDPVQGNQEVLGRRSTEKNRPRRCTRKARSPSRARRPVKAVNTSRGPRTFNRLLKAKPSLRVSRRRRSNPQVIDPPSRRLSLRS